MSLKLWSVLAMVCKIGPGIGCYVAKSGSFLRKSEKCVCFVCVCMTTLIHIAYTLCNIPICVYDVYLCRYNKYLQMTYTFTNDVRFVNVGLTKFNQPCFPVSLMEFFKFSNFSGKRGWLNFVSLR